MSLVARKIKIEIQYENADGTTGKTLEILIEKEDIKGFNLNITKQDQHWLNQDGEVDRKSSNLSLNVQYRGVNQ